MEVKGHTSTRPDLLILVFVGGATGTAVRWALEARFGAPAGSWPWATLAINLTGSFLLGGVLEALAATGPDSGWRRRVRLGVGTGVLGGFTTYSTFSVETVNLIRAGLAWQGLAYGVASVTAGIVLAFTGTRTARALVRHRRAA